MIWIDGRRGEGALAPFDLTDRGLTLGDGLFETMLAASGRVHRLADHLMRLERGLAVLGFAVARGRLEDAVALAAAEAPASGGVIRLTVTRGGGARGLAPPEAARPTVIVLLSPWDPAPVGRPLRLATAGVARNDRSPTSRLKSLCYLDGVLALADARAQGADDALMLNTAGRVACTSVGTVLRLRDGRLETPPEADGVLAGTIRARLFALAPALGLTVAERSLAPRDLADGSAVLVTNAVRLLQPVSVLDGRDLAEPPAVVTELLAALIADLRAETGLVPTSVGAAGP